MKTFLLKVFTKGKAAINRSMLEIVRFIAVVCCLIIAMFCLVVVGFNWSYNDYCGKSNEEYFITEFPNNIQLAIGCPNYVPPAEPEPETKSRVRGYSINVPGWELYGLVEEHIQL